MNLMMYLQLPLLLALVSLVYSATRYDQWDLILSEAVRWGLRMAMFLLAIGAVMFLIGFWILNPAS